MSTLEQALNSSTVADWIAFFKTADIPVLRQTARDIEVLKADEDNTSARDITLAVLKDPMMVFKVLTYAQGHKGRQQLQDLVQVEQAVIMLGTSTFFNHIVPEPTVETVIGSRIIALTHLLKLIKRAHRASHYAIEWAAYLKDLHAEDVRLAALLRDLAEMLMWCFAPEKMLEMHQMQQQDRQLRSTDVQLQVLTFKLMDLQKALVEAFGLPPLLTELMDEDKADLQRVKNVRLAVNLARHSANGWDDAALPDDYKEIAGLLHVDVSRAMHLIGVPAASAPDAPAE